MNKFSITMVSLATMAGFAMAQPKTDPKAGSGAAAGAGAGATVKAGAGAGSAAAGAGAKVEAGATAQVKMEKPKPPAEHAAFLKTMGTRMNCTGITWTPDKAEMKMKSTGTNALALDGFQIKGAMAITMGEGKMKHVLKFESYMTWDAKASLWRSVGAGNDGSVMIGTSTMKDGKMESSSDVQGGMMGSGKMRERGEMTDPKAGWKMTGEWSSDGKTWTKIYEMTCKK